MTLVRYAHLPWWLPVTLGTIATRDSTTYSLGLHRRRLRHALSVGLDLTLADGRWPRARPWAAWRVDR